MSETKELKNGVVLNKHDAYIATSDVSTFYQMESNEAVAALLEFAQGNTEQVTPAFVERLKYHELIQPDGTMSDVVKNIVLSSLKSEGKFVSFDWPFVHHIPTPRRLSFDSQL